ncbi:MAG: thiamine diphosphokinase [Bacteroidales bacterium]|nr:thiamine diphosphokinase [Bacteroidales bacterium]
MEENNTKMSAHTIIIADGTFPTHAIPLSYIRNAEKIICCDGSADNTVLSGFTPDAIVGDMDSLSSELADRFADRIFPDDDQATNDLTKAVTWCRESGLKDLVIVGATGKREDHTIGNISLLAEYVEDVKVIMVTDTGLFMPLLKTTSISTFKGQQVSLFAIDPDTEITTHGLRYPLNRTKIKNWWFATLNEALGDTFTIEFSSGRVIVYLKFAPMPP